MKKLLTTLVFFCGLIVANFAHAAIVFDTSSTFITSTASTTFKWAHTVTTTANSVLVVCVCAMTNAETSTGASYGGIAMTNLLTDKADAVDTQSIYYLLNPPTGTNNISTTVAISASNIVFMAESFAGVSGIGNSINASSSSGTVTSLTLTVTNGSMITDMVTTDGASSAPSVSSQQTQVAVTSTPAGTRWGGEAFVVATGTTITNTWAKGASGAWVEGDIELLAVASAGPRPIMCTIQNARIMNGKIY